VGANPARRVGAPGLNARFVATNPDGLIADEVYEQLYVQRGEAQNRIREQQLGLFARHAGACLGTLLCGILLVPVFGTATAALLLAGMKLVSAGLRAVGRRFSSAA